MSEKEMEHMNSIYKKLKTIKFEIIIEIGRAHV